MNDLWVSWMNGRNPGEVLREADEAVRAGTCLSRRQYFVEQARRALSAAEPATSGSTSAERLATALQEYAETSESVSP